MFNRKKVAISWSGGKDACLALYQVMKQNYDVVCLVSMVSKKDSRNHAHGLPLDILQIQADALGLPLVLVDSAGEYEHSLVNAFIHLKEEQGVDGIVFGSLYMEEDRKWNEKVTHKAGLTPLFPVWTTKDASPQLFHEFVELGFKAVVCRASDKYFDKTWVGRLFDLDFYHETVQKDICVMGEMGEYHTFVLDGPIFHKAINILKSDIILNSGLWSLDIQMCQTSKKGQIATFCIFGVDIILEYHSFFFGILNRKKKVDIHVRKCSTFFKQNGRSNFT